MIYRLALAFCSFILCFSVQAQETQNGDATYFRFFEVTTEGLSEDVQNKVFTSFSRQTVMDIKNYCPASNKLLIAVKADYPKRIDEIIQEIRKTLEDASKISNVIKIETIALSDTSNFCK